MGEATTCSSPDLGHLCNNLLSLMSDRNLALALNPLHPDGWFALGSASLKVGLISQFFFANVKFVSLGVGFIFS
jgi:hypothetical protein